MIEQNDVLILSEKTFQILNYENSIFTPDYFKLSPTWSDDEAFFCQCTYELKEYRLYLKDFLLCSDRLHPEVNGVKPELCAAGDGRDTVIYRGVMEPLNYSGALIIAEQLISHYDTSHYNMAGEIPCYCYKTVKELIFMDGMLTAALDQSKAMARIRKNLDLGLRRLDKKRDFECIEKFVKTSFTGDYEPMNKKRRRILKRFFHKKSYFTAVKH